MQRPLPTICNISLEFKIATVLHLHMNIHIAHWEVTILRNGKRRYIKSMMDLSVNNGTHLYKVRGGGGCTNGEGERDCCYPAI
jgi:hypothetical protein